MDIPEKSKALEELDSFHVFGYFVGPEDFFVAVLGECDAVALGPAGDCGLSLFVRGESDFSESQKIEGVEGGKKKLMIE